MHILYLFAVTNKIKCPTDRSAIRFHQPPPCNTLPSFDHYIFIPRGSTYAPELIRRPQIDSSMAEKERTESFSRAGAMRQVQSKPHHQLNQQKRIHFRRRPIDHPPHNLQAPFSVRVPIHPSPDTTPLHLPPIKIKIFHQSARYREKRSSQATKPPISGSIYICDVANARRP